MPCKTNISTGKSTTAIISGTAERGDVRAACTFVPNTGATAAITGTMPDCQVTEITPGATDETIPAGSYIAQDITIRGDENLVAENIRAGISIFGVEGDGTVVNTGAVTATAADIRAGKMIIADGQEVEGTMPDCAVTEVTPGISDIVLSAGQYIAKTIRVIGDAALAAANIRHGKSIFGISGTFTSDATMTADKLVSGYSGYAKGTKVTGSMADRGSGQFAVERSDGKLGGVSGSTFWINIPNGWYHSDQKTQMPAKISLANLRSLLGITSDKLISGASVAGISGSRTLRLTNKIDVVAYHSVRNSEGSEPGPNEASFTAPADGYLIYSGVSHCVGTSEKYRDVRCEIYVNGTLVDDRNCDADNDYFVRGTMVNKTRALNKGDTVKLYASVGSSGNWTYSMLTAMFAYM